VFIPGLIPAQCVQGIATTNRRHESFAFSSNEQQRVSIATPPLIFNDVPFELRLTQVKKITKRVYQRAGGPINMVMWTAARWPSHYGDVDQILRE